MLNSGNYKTLGVIGGMGPQATAYFYNGLIEHTKASCDQEHINTIILSHATTPDRTKAILSGKTKEAARSLTEDAKTLEQMGAENIVVTCNTAHYFYDAMQSAVHVPVIHMIRESVRYAKGMYENVRRIGIMATDGTISSGIYDRECEAAGVTPVHPGPQKQADVMHIIYDEIKAGQTGSEELFDGVMEEFTKELHCDVVILACTELSVYKGYHKVADCCLDAMDVLIREAILRSGAEYV